MPDSPKIWGTLELEKQEDRLQRQLQAAAHCSAVPGRQGAGGGPGVMPQGAP